MPSSQGSGPGLASVSAVSRQSRTAATSAAVRRSRRLAAVSRVAERMFTRFGREGEQVGSQGRPGGFGGESWDVLVGLVELCDGLGSEELFGCDAEGVGVALDRLEEPGRWVVELAQLGVAETGASSLPRICCNVSVGVRGEMVSGRMTVCGSPSPTTWR
jgi:hypothetical protein